MSHPFARVGGASLRVCLHCWWSHLFVLFYSRTMSTKITNFGIVNYYDHHKEVTINGATNAAEIVRNFMAEDVEPVQDEQEPQTEYFRYITKLAIEQKRAEIVDAEIRAACRGTAEMLWRTLWNNENLGYVEVEYTDATTLYRDIEKRYGKLPYSERQFRAARNKR